jgi:hypothetical protein
LCPSGLGRVLLPDRVVILPALVIPRWVAMMWGRPGLPELSRLSRLGLSLLRSRGLCPSGLGRVLLPDRVVILPSRAIPA